MGSGGIGDHIDPADIGLSKETLFANSGTQAKQEKEKLMETILENIEECEPSKGTMEGLAKEHQTLLSQAEGDVKSAMMNDPLIQDEMRSGHVSEGDLDEHVQSWSLEQKTKFVDTITAKFDPQKNAASPMHLATTTAKTASKKKAPASPPKKPAPKGKAPPPVAQKLPDGSQTPHGSNTGGSTPSSGDSKPSGKGEAKPKKKVSSSWEEFTKLGVVSKSAAAGSMGELLSILRSGNPDAVEMAYSYCQNDMGGITGGSSKTAATQKTAPKKATPPPPSSTTTTPAKTQPGSMMSETQEVKALEQSTTALPSGAPASIFGSATPPADYKGPTTFSGTISNMLQQAATAFKACVSAYNAVSPPTEAAYTALQAQHTAIYGVKSTPAYGKAAATPASAGSLIKAVSATIGDKTASLGAGPKRTDTSDLGQYLSHISQDSSAAAGSDPLTDTHYIGHLMDLVGQAQADASISSDNVNMPQDQALLQANNMIKDGSGKAPPCTGSTPVHTTNYKDNSYTMPVKNGDVYLVSAYIKGKSPPDGKPGSYTYPGAVTVNGATKSTDAYSVPKAKSELDLGQQTNAITSPGWHREYFWVKANAPDGQMTVALGGEKGDTPADDTQMKGVSVVDLTTLSATYGGPIDPYSSDDAAKNAMNLAQKMIPPTLTTKDLAVGNLPQAKGQTFGGGPGDRTNLMDANISAHTNIPNGVPGTPAHMSNGSTYPYYSYDTNTATVDRGIDNMNTMNVDAGASYTTNAMTPVEIPPKGSTISYSYTISVAVPPGGTFEGSITVAGQDKYANQQMKMPKVAFGDKSVNNTNSVQTHDVTVKIPESFFANDQLSAGSSWSPSFTMTSGSSPLTMYNPRLVDTSSDKSATPSGVYSWLNKQNPYLNTFPKSTDPSATQNGSEITKSGEWGVAQTGNGMYGPSPNSMQYTQATPNGVTVNSTNSNGKWANGGIESSKMLTGHDNFNISMTFSAKSTPGYYPTMALWTYGESDPNPDSPAYHRAGPGAKEVTEFDEEMGTNKTYAPDSPVTNDNELYARDGNYVGAQYGGSSEITNRPSADGASTWGQPQSSFWNKSTEYTLSMTGTYNSEGDLIMTRKLYPVGSSPDSPGAIWSQANVGKGPFNAQNVKIVLENPGWNSSAHTNGRASLNITSLTVSQEPPTNLKAGVTIPTTPQDNTDYAWFTPSGGGGTAAYIPFPTNQYPWTDIPPTNIAQAEQSVAAWINSNASKTPSALQEALQTEITNIEKLKSASGSAVATEKLQEAVLKSWATGVVAGEVPKVTWPPTSGTPPVTDTHAETVFKSISMLSDKGLGTQNLPIEDIETLCTALEASFTGADDLAVIKDIGTLAKAATGTTAAAKFFSFVSSVNTEIKDKGSNLGKDFPKAGSAVSSIVTSLTNGMVPAATANPEPPIPATQTTTLAQFNTELGVWNSQYKGQPGWPTGLYKAAQAEYSKLNTQGVTNVIPQLQYWALMEEQGPDQSNWKYPMAPNFFKLITNTTLVPLDPLAATPHNDLQSMMTNLISTVPSSGPDFNFLHAMQSLITANPSANSTQLAQLMKTQWDATKPAAGEDFKGMWSATSTATKAIVTSITAGVIPPTSTPPPPSGWPPTSGTASTSMSQVETYLKKWSEQVPAPSGGLYALLQAEYTKLTGPSSTVTDPNAQFQAMQYYVSAVENGAIEGTTWKAATTQNQNFFSWIGGDPTDWAPPNESKSADYLKPLIANLAGELTGATNQNDLNLLTQMQALANDNLGKTPTEFQQAVLAAYNNNTSNFETLFKAADPFLQKIITAMTDGVVPGSGPTPFNPHAPTSVDDAVSQIKQWAALNPNNKALQSLASKIEGQQADLDKITPAALALNMLELYASKILEIPGNLNWKGLTPALQQQFKIMTGTVNEYTPSPQTMGASGTLVTQVIPYLQDVFSGDANEVSLLKDISTIASTSTSATDFETKLAAAWTTGGPPSMSDLWDQIKSDGDSEPIGSLIQGLTGAQFPPNVTPPYTPPSSPPTTVAEALADAKAWQTAYDAEHPGGNPWINGLVTTLESYPSGDNINVLQGLGALLEDEGAQGDPVGQTGQYSFLSIFKTITNTGGTPRYPTQQGGTYAAEALSLFETALPSGQITAADMALVKNAVTSLQGGATIQSVLATLQSSWSGAGLDAITNFLTSSEPAAPPYTPPSSPPTTVAEALKDAQAWQKAYNTEHSGGNPWINGLVTTLESYPSGDNINVLQGLGALLEDEGAQGDPVGQTGQYSFLSIFKTITNTGGTPRYPTQQGGTYAAEALSLFETALPSGQITAADMALVKNAVTSLQGGATIQSVLATLQSSWSGAGLDAITNFLTSSEPAAPPYTPPSSPPTTVAEALKDAQAWQKAYNTEHPGGNPWINGLVTTLESYPSGDNINVLQGLGALLEDEGASGDAVGQTGQYSFLSIFKTITNTGGTPRYPTKQGSTYAAEVLDLFTTAIPAGQINAADMTLVKNAVTSLEGGTTIQSVIQTLTGAWTGTGLDAITNLLTASETGSGPPTPWPPTSPPTTLAEMQKDLDYYKSLNPTNRWVTAMDNAAHDPGVTMDSLQGYASVVEQWGMPGSQKTMLQLLTNTQPGTKLTGSGDAYAKQVLTMLGTYAPSGTVSAANAQVLLKAATSSDPISYVQANFKGAAGVKNSVINFLKSAVPVGPPSVWPPTSPPTTLAAMQKDLDYYKSLNPTNRWVVAVDNAAHAPGVTMESLEGYASIVEQWGMPGTKQTMIQLLTNTQPGTPLTGKGAAYVKQVLTMLGNNIPTGTISAASSKVLLNAAKSSDPLSYVQANFKGAAGVKNSIIKFLKAAEPSA